jgi:hypothetical protein
MSSEIQATLRVTIPGTIILLAILPLFKEEFSYGKLVSFFNDSKDLAYLLVIPVLGGLYHLIGVRRLFLKDAQRTIQNNIKDQLLSACRHDQTIASASDRLREGNLLIDVFYNLVDNDESLRERAKQVRLNGVLWSSAADLKAISAFFICVYVIAYLILGRFHYLPVAIVLGVLYFLASFWLLPITTRKHIELSNRQLGYITSLLNDELCTRLRAQAEAQR